ncbi:MAG TPA: Uma2 family endonuclease [Pseudonocardiaceae bacterium]
MTALPDWMTSHPDGLTAADYDALPEEICRRIEIVDGGVVVNVAPCRAHQHLVRHFATALGTVLNERLAVTFNVDLRLVGVPLLNRRPDVVVYDASLADDEVLRPRHCVLVVEVMSPGSVTTDRFDKPAEYAAAGIEHFWRIEMSDHGPTVFRYRLDPTTRTYSSAGVDDGTMAVTEPVAMTVVLADLR